MPLTREKIEQFQRELWTEKQSLEKEIADIANPQTGGLSKTAYPDFQNVPGAQDENVAEVEAYESLLAIHRHLGHRLEEINRALDKITKGSYGFCENCQEEIPLERLEANPAAATCIKCSEK